MAKILTNVTAMHEHYLSCSYSVVDFTRFATMNITASGTVTGQTLTNVPATLPTFGANTKIFAHVDSITDIASNMTITVKQAAAVIGTATVVAHAPIDAIFPVQNAGAWTVAPATGFTVDLATATAGVVINLIVLDDDPTKWFDLGLNYQEGVSFEDGAMSAPVARGWNSTDHAKRIPTGNQWSISQLYCSQFEGVANLRGKTVMIKDEIKTDGSATIKETTWVTKATVQNAGVAIGGGGGGAAADSVHASGYYARSYTWTADATALTATV